MSDQELLRRYGNRLFHSLASTVRDVASRNGQRRVSGLFHLQFGINATLGVFAFGLVFALAYWCWRQLWPLIVAHTLTDLIALLYGSYHAH